MNQYPLFKHLAFKDIKILDSGNAKKHKSNKKSPVTIMVDLKIHPKPLTLVKLLNATFTSFDFKYAKFQNKKSNGSII